MITKNYRFGDLVFRIATPLPLKEDSRFEAFRCNEADEVDFSFRILPKKAGPREWPVRITCDGVHVAVEAEPDLISGITLGNLLGAAQAPLWLPDRGCFILHCAYVLHGGKALLLCAVLLAGIGLEVWLEHRPLPDTDPNAPFQDLPDRTKEKIKVAAKEYYHYSHHGERFWYGDPPSDDWQDPLEYGMRYYGTFGGYHIVLAPIHSATGMPQTRVIDGYRFSWTDSFHIYAYKDGKVMKLEDAYELGLISKSQLDMIYQCFEQYNHEVYLGKDA